MKQCALLAKTYANLLGLPAGPRDALMDEQPELTTIHYIFTRALPQPLVHLLEDLLKIFGDEELEHVHDGELDDVSIDRLLPNRQFLKRVLQAVLHVLLEQLLHASANLPITQLLVLLAVEISQQSVRLDHLHLLTN